MARVFLLEALPAIREYLRMELGQMGHEVIDSVGDGQVGLQRIRQTHPDLVILGLSMPGKSGLDLIDRIKAHSPGSRLLVYTALNAEHFAPLCLKAGVNGFVSKSEDLDVLRSSIRSVLNGRNHYPALPHAAVEGDELSVLSPRELSVLQLIGEGKTNQAIADILSISFKTVSTHKSHLQEKLRLTSRLELVEVARRHGLGRSAIDDGYVSQDVPQQWRAHIDRLQAMLDAVGHPMFLRDRDGRLLLCNRAFLEFYQVTAEDVAGQDIQGAVWFDPEQRQRLEARYAELVAAEQPCSLEHTTSVHGSERVLHLWGMPYRDDQGRMLGMVGGVRDLTHQARIMQSLREERRRTRLASEARMELFELILLELHGALASTRLRVGDEGLVELDQLVARLHRLADVAQDKRPSAEEPCDVGAITLEELKRHGVELSISGAAAAHCWLDGPVYRELLEALSQLVGPASEATLVQRHNSSGMVEYQLTLTDEPPRAKGSIILWRTAELLAGRLDASLARTADGRTTSLVMTLEEAASP
ncbi:LuxR C-terminal-related transcriptional regulator [Pseudomonas sp. Pseusp97]|uniref:LuxR C-terminal-related transcriptional regulator n=1 Tax=Pseudomonas sp. Pseusp97 TaxID=3243065 RepID=UPI0039A73359